MSLFTKCSPYYKSLFRLTSSVSRNNDAGLVHHSVYHSERYETEFRKSIENPEDYWGEISANIVWTKPWTKVLDNSKSPFTKWFVGGELSHCYNAVDRHVDEGHGERKAIIYDSPITGGTKRTITFKQLQNEVSRFAGVLSRRFNVKKGDRVVIYMPMIPEAVIAMLSVVRIGAVHSVVFGGFAAKELSTRIRHLEPKVILTASCGVEPSRLVEYKPIVDEALTLAGVPDLPTVVFQRSELNEANLRVHKDYNWQEVIESVNDPVNDCVPVESNEPLYVLYTSGTTGDPKGIQLPTGPHAVVNKWTMNALYGRSPGDVWWTASDLGWTVGHGYICYSPLLSGITTIIYEGKPVGTPDPGQFFRVISEYGVKSLFTAPTALRAIHKEEDPNAESGSKYDIGCLETLFVAGEHCDDETRNWAQKRFNVPVLDHWWQTETAHAITATCVGLGHSLNPPKNVTGMPVPGFNVKILKDDGSEAKVGELGKIMCRLPLAPGTMSTMFKGDQRFKDTYFSTHAGYYDTMDSGIKDKDGYIQVLARDDDVINVAGHRIACSLLEEVILSSSDVVDCAVVGFPDSLKGHVPLAIVVRKLNDKNPEDISENLIASVRKDIGPIASLRAIVYVSGLPRTRSGKTPRKSIADMAAGKLVKIPPTIEDPNIYKELRNALKTTLNITVEEPI